MLSIGTLSKQTGVKIPTIRYYEQIGLICPAGRTQGNQRQYRESELERLKFIKHAREIGFSIGSIASLIELNNHPDNSCAQADEIVRSQLAGIKMKITSLKKLEAELIRISDSCKGEGVVSDCSVLASLADHGQCQTDHSVGSAGNYSEKHNT